MTAFKLSEARLGGQRLLARIDRAMVDLSLEETTQGASSVTMTVRDAGLVLLRSGIITEGVLLHAWERDWVCAGIGDDSSREVTITFESKIANDLKKDTGAVSMNATRLAFTRAIASARRPRLKVTVPDERRVTGASFSSLGAGIASSDRVVIRGKAATREQRVAIDVALGEAWRRHSSVAVMRALVAAMIAETNALNVVADAFSRGGILRLPATKAVAVDARDMRAVAAWFVETARTGSSDVIAGKVLGKSRTVYAPFIAQAAQIVTTFNRGTTVNIAAASALVKKHLTQKLALSVGAPQGEARESKWAALQRVWTELGWYAFERGNDELIIMSGQHARVAKPDFVIRPDDAGVIEPSFSSDESFRTNSASFTMIEQVEGTIRGGMIVDVADYGAGDGRYIVTKVGRSTGTRIVQVDVETPVSVVAAQNQAAPSSSSSVDVASIDGVPDAVVKAYARAVAINKLRYGYLAPAPWDCSYAISQVLIAGGALGSRQTTVGLASVGKHGPGQFFTFFNDKRPGNFGHVYGVFTLPGRQPERFEFHGPTGARGGFVGPGSVTSYLPRYEPRSIPGW